MLGCNISTIEETSLSWNRWCHHVCLKTTLCTKLSCAVGDLGTYIPIVLALTLVSHLDLSTTLIFTSLYNFATGLLFCIPMPLQNPSAQNHM
ncbi:putative molybdate transporter 1/2 [Rosa chinensis]|uniref:Putative molybdate transporter 1/2 n=1 Tax=Rosa chinensis TaxID=74649 RepID=A0A2P6QT36_ROSCH|nr:putative molybdate transporter 1/2 [Rosa chinensis]